MPVYSMRNRVSCANSWITTRHFELQRALYDDITADLRPKLREIKVPVTILYAWDNLAPIPQATVDEIYRQNYGSLSNKTLVRVDGSFHFIMLDQPEVFATQTEMFLK